MNYKNYSNEDLIEAYNTMLDYSGKASNEILLEIDKRGGLDVFLSNIEFNKSNKEEINRISQEVYNLSKDFNDLEFIKGLIKSETLEHNELDKLVTLKFEQNQAFLKNRKIDQKTIFGSLVGMIIGIIISLIFYILVTSLLGKFVFYPIIGVYFICYQAIKLITKQTRDNILVFLSSFAGTILTMVILFLFSR
ncbi:hypothetical protein [Flavobacterium saccharophilum]|uniref:Uncharacterized protein n=1 Tax=Flavobacterium saccharophilum TaxID=29534 RepID=A0A1M7M813_9FLAO|nr:hypothetical protein [Flavobacterium saccharophilum]SHM86809.1 hypothetical protein SAMN05444366_4400 [Flavobacterium saccharophilum]